MKANEWWSKIRSVCRAADNGEPGDLHALCEKLEALEALTEPPPVPVVPEKLHAVTPAKPLDIEPTIFG